MAEFEFTDELKSAILSLPDKEKDKLLLRLVKKDALLSEQLHYRLLENSQSDLDYRVSDIKEKIDTLFIDQGIGDCGDIDYYFRRVVVFVNHYFKVTKDHKGELDLLVYTFKKVMIYSHLCEEDPMQPRNWKKYYSREKLIKYCLQKFQKAQKLLEKLHPDYHLEYEDDLEQISRFIQ